MKTPIPISRNPFKPGYHTKSQQKGNSIRLNPDSRTVLVPGSTTWAELDAYTQQFGMAAPGSIFSYRTVNETLANGSFSWLRRKYGSLESNIVSSVEVGPNGEKVYELKIYPAGPKVTFCFAIYSMENATEVLYAYRRYIRQAPAEVGTMVILGTLPDAEPLEDGSYETHIMIAGCHIGSLKEGEGMLSELTTFGEPEGYFFGPMEYEDAQQFFDPDYNPNDPLYTMNWRMEPLSNLAIARLLSHIESRPSGRSRIMLSHTGNSRGIGETFQIRFESDRAAGKAATHWTQYGILEMASLNLEPAC